MKKINLEFQDFINKEQVSHEYVQGPQAFAQFCEYLARNHKIPVNELNIRETITNSLITNEQDLLTYSKNLAIDSPNPLYCSSKSMVESVIMQVSQHQKKIMIDQEVQVSMDQQPIKKMIEIPKTPSQSIISTFSSSPLKQQITQEEMKIKLKALIQEVKVQQLEMFMQGGDKQLNQQDEKIDQLRRRRVNELKKYDKDILQIENEINNINEMLKEVQFTSAEQMEEIEKLLAKKEELEKKLDIKEKQRYQLQTTLNKPMTIQEVRDEFFKMKWKIYKKIKQIKHNLDQNNITDVDFLEQLNEIEQQTNKLDKELSNEIFVIDKFK